MAKTEMVQPTNVEPHTPHVLYLKIVQNNFMPAVSNSESVQFEEMHHAR